MIPEDETSDDTPARLPANVKATVVIMANRCKGCMFCVEFCPTDALEMSREMNAKGYHYPELTRPDQCNGCNLCGMLCPDFAIYGYFEKLRK